MRALRFASLLLLLGGLSLPAFPAAPEVGYTGDGTDLQAVVDRLPDGAVLRLPTDRVLTLKRALVLRRPVTLVGLRARLPDGLGETSLVEIRGEGVRLFDVELQGNYRTVSQSGRAPLVYVTRGGFVIEGAVLREATK